MPGEAPAESQGPVRRSGRAPKRTDKLEEFLLTTKRGGRRSGPASLEGGDPPSQTPTDVETASEASFDGNAEGKSVDDKCESPERRTRSGSRRTYPGKAKGGPGPGVGGGSVKDEGSSENEEDGGEDASKKPQSKDGEQPRELDLDVKESEKPSPAVEEEAAAEPLQKKENVEEEEKIEETVEKKEEEAAAAATKEEEETKTKEITVTGMTRSSNRAAKPVSLSSPIKRETKAKPGPKSRKVQEEEEDSEDESLSSSIITTSSSSSSDPEDAGGYDPNALYCICRQKHNKRFMICCDRCEEWFHGDCVGITEARGRLMERNGEDYVCPNCNAKRSLAAKAAAPATAAENGKSKAAATLPGIRKPDSSMSVSLALSAPLATPSAGSEEKAADDLGIKGRIEKATNPSGKKKIKIFQPTAPQPAATAPTAAQATPTQPAIPPTTQPAPQPATQPAAPPAAQPAAPPAAPPAALATVATEEKAVEVSDLPKCMGPGCVKNAQPESVYCGNDCILRHAAAAMKSITDVKETKQKDKGKPKGQKKKKKKPGTRLTPKKSPAAGKRRKSKKSTEEEESDSEEEEVEEEEADENERAEDHPPPPAASSWSSDHNYNAVTPEKTTTPISSTVLNKTCMYLLEGFDKFIHHAPFHTIHAIGVVK